MDVETVRIALDHLQQLLPVKAKWAKGKGMADGQVVLKIGSKVHCMDGGKNKYAARNTV